MADNLWDTHGRRNREAQGARALPTFQRLGQSAPFRVIWLPSVKALKMQKLLEKCAFPGISEDLNSKISRGSMPRTPLAALHCFTPQTQCSISLPKTLPRFPSIYALPTFITLSTSLGTLTSLLKLMADSVGL